MASLTEEQFQAMLEAFESRGYEVRKKGFTAPSATSAKVVLEEKYFRRIEKFGGDPGNWQEWLFGVCVAIGAVASDCVVAMEDVIKNSGTIKNVAELDMVLDEEMKDKYGSELFGVLCSLTSGEANVVVRSILQKGAGYCGFAALCVLSQRFNPKTPARILQFLTTVLNPPAVKDVRLLERAVEEWEIKVGKLKVEFGEEFSDNVKVAIITGMVPRDLQDMIFQMGRAGEDIKHIEVRDRVMGIASHRGQMVTPSPMDIGWVGEQGWDYDLEEGGVWNNTQEVEVDAVQKASSVCHRCGGRGHFARECATPVDAKGIHGKGKAKGKGKVGPKGGFPGRGGFQGKADHVTSKGTGPKGSSKGFGYQGTCWTCGRVGHKAAECSHMQIGEVAAATPESREVANVGGVWSISQVRSVTQVAKPLDETTHRLEEGVKASATSNASAFVAPASGMEGGWQVKAGRWRPAAMKNKKKAFEVTGGRFKVLDICPVGVEGDAEADVCGVATAVTVDSAAEESVCPRGWGEQFGIHPVSAGHEMKLVNASGGKINHYGSRQVAMQADGRLLGMNFEVTDVKKPLVAVTRICERGNLVQFGPEAQHNFIQHIGTGDKLFMERRGNSYVLPGELADVNPF